jgi:hypothetical protein
MDKRKHETPSSPLGSYALRWEALLAENSALLKEHLDLLASLSTPVSKEQMQQFVASEARLASLPPRVRQLVEDWSTSVSC